MCPKFIVGSALAVMLAVAGIAFAGAFTKSTQTEPVAATKHVAETPAAKAKGYVCCDICPECCVDCTEDQCSAECIACCMALGCDCDCCKVEMPKKGQAAAPATLKKSACCDGCCKDGCK